MRNANDHGLRLVVAVIVVDQQRSSMASKRDGEAMAGHVRRLGLGYMGIATGDAHLLIWKEASIMYPPAKLIGVGTCGSGSLRAFGRLGDDVPLFRHYNSLAYQYIVI